MNQPIFIIINLIFLFPQCVLSQFTPDILIYPASPVENDTLILTCSGETSTNVTGIEERLSISGYIINMDVKVYTGPLTIVGFWRTNDTIGLLPTGSYSVNLSLTICSPDYNFGGFFICGITETYHNLFNVITEVILKQLAEPSQYLRIGFAHYDMKQYGEALFIFERFEKKFGSDTTTGSRALIWQGHMLDLLGEREEAMARYKIVADLNSKYRVQHAQYNLSYELSPYAKERIETPFKRIENQIID